MKLTLLQGVSGYSVYLNDYRIAGGKPWGGGTVVKEWEVSPELMDAALQRNDAGPRPASEEA